MKRKLAIGLVHYPINDRSGKVIATNITNFDIHDIARAARVFDVQKPEPHERYRVFDVQKYFIIHFFIIKNHIISISKKSKKVPNFQFLPPLYNNYKLIPTINQAMENNNPDNNLRIFVGNLTPKTTNQKLLEYFNQFGPIASAEVVYDKNNGIITF